MHINIYKERERERERERDILYRYSYKRVRTYTCILYFPVRLRFPRHTPRNCTTGLRRSEVLYGSENRNEPRPGKKHEHVVSVIVVPNAIAVAVAAPSPIPSLASVLVASPLCRGGKRSRQAGMYVLV